MADIAQGSAVQEERLLAAIMRRMLTVDRTWAGLEGDDLYIDGWVRLTPDEEALVRRITGEGGDVT